MLEWIPSDQAFQHVLSIVFIDELANRKLYERIRTGDIACRAERFSFVCKVDDVSIGKPDVIVPLDFWNARPRIDFANRVALREDYSLVAGWGTPPELLSTTRALGLSCNARQLYQFFPPLQFEMLPQAVAAAVADLTTKEQAVHSAVVALWPNGMLAGVTPKDRDTQIMGWQKAKNISVSSPSTIKRYLSKTGQYPAR